MEGKPRRRSATKILIISDLHGNLEAVRSLPSDYGELWVLGDLVNYGPDPAEVIEFVRANASLVVRGNHDHSVAWDGDPRCSARFRRMAEETGRYTKSAITEEHREYLRRRLIINPGSVGQPKHGIPRACYAIWEDGDLRLESCEYPLEETVAKMRSLPVSPEVRADLETVLRSGSGAALIA